MSQKQVQDSPKWRTNNLLRVAKKGVWKLSLGNCCSNYCGPYQIVQICTPRLDQFCYVWNDAHCAFLDPLIHALCSEFSKSNFPYSLDNCPKRRACSQARRLSFSSSSSPWFEEILLLSSSLSSSVFFEAFDIRNMQPSGISKFPSKIVKNIVQIIACPMLRDAAELKLSLLLL